MPSCDGAIYALNRRTGRPVWKFEAAGGEYHSSPVVEGKTLYVGNDDGHLYAVSVVSGELLWSAVLNSPCWPKPLMLPGRVVAATMDGNLFCVRRTDGAILWRARAGKCVYMSDPVEYERSIVVGTTDGLLTCIDAESARKCWSLQVGEGILGGPAVSDGFAYIACRSGLCLKIDLDRRKKVWSRRLLGGNFYAPALGPGVMVAGTGAGMIYALDRETGGVIWKKRVRGRAGHCSIGGKTLLVACWNGTLRAFAVKDGSPAWTLTTGGDIRGFVTVDDGWVFTGSIDGSLYAIRTDVRR